MEDGSRTLYKVNATRVKKYRHKNVLVCVKFSVAGLGEGCSAGRREQVGSL